MAQKFQRALTFLILSCLIFCTTNPLFSAQKFDCTKYHDYKEVTEILKGFQRKYSNLAQLTSMGKSIKSKNLWVMEITAKKTGEASEKPAIFITGGMRGNEVVGTEVSLYTIKYLLENYGKEDQVTELIDSRTFYIMPAMNPDACDFSVKNPDNPIIKNFRKVDEDFDGKIDEDPAEDINKDGFITKMRVKDKEGNFQISKIDSRVMLPKKGKGDTYKLYVEGTDNDKDEKYNEDGIGGVDLNRNFPSGWKMEYEQSGAGMYPGSEPESEAVMKFFIDHPNITFVLAYASGEGALYRPFNHLADKEIPKLDLKVYENLGKEYKKLTGMEMTHGFNESGKKSPGKSSPTKQPRSATRGPSQMQKKAVATKTIAAKKETNKTKPTEYGTFIDWTYKDYNVYSFAANVWTVPEEYKSEVDSAKKEIQAEIAWFNFFEKEWNGKGFVPWAKYKHPQLGDVEIGGWNKFYTKNPPPGKRLEKVCEDNIKFTLTLANKTPEIKIKEIKINPIQVLSGVSKAQSSVAKDGAIKVSMDSKKVAGKAVIAELKIKVENVGKLGTRTALGQKTRYSMQPPRSVLATVEAKDNNLEILSLPKVLRLGNMEGSETIELAKEVAEKQTSEGRQGRQEQRQPRQEKKKKDKDEPNLKSGTWLVKIEGGSAELVFRVSSEKGGTVVKKVKVDL